MRSRKQKFDQLSQAVKNSNYSWKDLFENVVTERLYEQCASDADIPPQTALENINNVIRTEASSNVAEDEAGNFIGTIRGKRFRNQFLTAAGIEVPELVRHQDLVDEVDGNLNQGIITNLMREQILRASTPEASAAPASAAVVANADEPAAAPLAPPAAQAPVPDAQGAAVQPAAPAPANAAPAVGAVAAPIPPAAPVPPVNAAPAAGAVAGPAVAPPIPPAGAAAAPANANAPAAAQGAPANPPAPPADPQDIIKFNNLCNNEAERKKFVDMFENADKYQSQLNAAHLKFLSAETSIAEINKIHRYLVEINERMTTFNEQVALLKRMKAAGNVVDPLQQAQPDDFHEVLAIFQGNTQCFNQIQAKIAQRQTTANELIAEANLIRNQNKYLFGKEKPVWTGDANTAQATIDAELDKAIGALNPQNPLDAQAGIQAGDDAPRENASRTHNWAIYRMEVTTTSRNPQTIVAATLHKVDPATNFSKMNFHLDDDAIAKFNNDFFTDRSLMGTRIPGNATTDWAARNIAILLEKMTPNPDGSYPMIKINGGVNNPPQSRAMPDHCIQALMLYCEFKGLKYQVRNADHVTINADQKKLMAKQWALKHPNDDQRQYVNAGADRQNLASAMQASEQAQAAAAPQAQAPAPAAAGANPPGAVPPPPPPPPPRRANQAAPAPGQNQVAAPAAQAQNQVAAPAAPAAPAANPADPQPAARPGQRRGSI